MDRNSKWPDNGADDRNAISLIWTTPSMYDTLISGIMTRSKFPWPENGTPGRKTISLIWKTHPMLFVGNFGGEEWVAIPNGRKTEPMAGTRFHLVGKRRRCMANLFWE